MSWDIRDSDIRDYIDLRSFVMEKRFLFFVLAAGLVLLFGVPSALAGKQRVEIFCDNDYPPYSYGENGRAAGIYADILRRAFSRMEDYDVTITPVPWRKGVALMRAGEGFALYPPYFRPKVRPFMDYPASVLDEGYAMVGTPDLKAKDPKVWPDDFKGMRVGVNSGYSIPDLDKARAMGVEIQEADTSQQNLEKLADGQVDAYINDKNALLWTLKQMKAGNESQSARYSKLTQVMDISREQGYLGFSNQAMDRFPFRSDFIRKFVAVIQKMKETGEIQAILDSYIQ
ncbi:MAG: transporter substrate-binding domain-containing protein [Desulfobacterales bacterium]|nr:transporter substrate-binding domain-containing protein [Desulfobacterales bacterium]